MIYLRLAGGLGNQLYQIAAASLISQAGAIQDTLVPLIDGLHRYDEPRHPDSLALLQTNNWILRSGTPVSTMWRVLSLSARAGRWIPCIGLSDRNYWRQNTRFVRFPILLDGYFQFGWTKESFKRAISIMPAHPILNSAANRISHDEVVVHIRGGDFLRLEQFLVVDYQYYASAVARAISYGFQRFAIVTDDFKYALSISGKLRELFSEISIRIVPAGVDALEDFDTLRAASARIIGNSTFAWWAAVYGSSKAITWAPLLLSKNKPRDFFLDNEIVID